MTTALTTVQALGVLAVLVGIAIVLPLGPALLAGGGLVVVLATAAERILLGRPAGRSDRRSGPNSQGVG